VPFLIQALEDMDKSVRAAAIAGLRKNRDPAAVRPLISCLTDSDPAIRAGAAEVLGSLGNRQAIPALNRMHHDRFIDVRDAAARALSRLTKTGRN